MSHNPFAMIVITFALSFVMVPVFFGFLKLLGFYTVVEEGQCKVFVLFGKTVGVYSEPGLHFLWGKMGPKAMIVNIFGSQHTVDMRMDQEYLRSQWVNSEEGAPMGIGIWYEMYVSDPVDYIFKNTDPRGSLRANVSNATVRSLSNMKLHAMLETRHEMSRAVRAEVSAKSHEWGYKLGSVYTRKVHFRDTGMVRQIEEKVVNRLRQVTSAISQDGSNQVNIIGSTAERTAAVEFARAVAIRPQILGAVLADVSKDKDVMEALFEVLETQRLLESKAQITLLPPGGHGGLMPQLMATRS